jgi:hypothetical protein
MTCRACEESARQVSHLFHANCRGCMARGVGRGPNFRRCRDAGRLDRKYEDELRLAGVTHAEVKAAHDADFLERAGA